MLKNHKINLFLLLLCYACNNYSDVSNLSQQAFPHGKFQLDSLSTFTIPIDKETPFEVHSLNYFSYEGGKFLAFLNTMNNSVYLYNYELRELIKKIPLQAEGPDGVGDQTENNGFFMDTPEHFYLLNSRRDILFNIDDQGKILESLNLRSGKEFEEYDLQPFTENGHPIIRAGNSLVIPGRFGNFAAIRDFNELPALLFVKIEPLSNPVWRGRMPDFFNQNFYSLHNYSYEPTYCLDFDEKNLLVAWPVSADIYSLSNNQISLSGAPVSPGVGPLTNPMSNDFSDYHKPVSDFLPHDKYTITTDCYHKLIRLNHNFILREVFDRPGAENFNKRKYMPKSSFMIINNHFDNMGETTLSGGHRFNIYFTNEKGLHIARETENENSLSFTIYQVSELQK
ncbi:MAG: DUF4221 family protein [Lewinellaceae bacterium]|nr:DUF4221 family protein [Lewinella sp.]MCB9280484.1 DUF4221 family protein [Lewinellaceae bacterium]